ncbi:MAG: MoaD/ThiS family protein [Desulfobacteraceae bacterium]
MGVKVYIHKTHRTYTDGLEVVEVEGGTVGDCLEDLVQQYPGMKEGLFDKKGKLLNVVEVYVNNESAYPEELAKSVKDGDEIQLILMLAGG